MDERNLLHHCSCQGFLGAAGNGFHLPTPIQPTPMYPSSISSNRRKRKRTPRVSGPQSRGLCVGALRQVAVTRGHPGHPATKATPVGSGATSVGFSCWFLWVPFKTTQKGYPPKAGKNNLGVRFAKLGSGGTLPIWFQEAMSNSCRLSSGKKTNDVFIRANTHLRRLASD